MRVRFVLLSAVAVLILFSACMPAYRIPYLSLDLKSVYNTSDININYTYVCEIQISAVYTVLSTKLNLP